MRTIISTIIFTALFISVFAQKHDYVWLFGYNSTNPIPNPDWGGTNIDFTTVPISLYRQERGMNLRNTNASICNQEGSLLFYTNGIYIANRENQAMENGLGLNPGEFAENNQERGYIVNQGALIIPQPEHENLYYLFHENREYPSDFLDWHSSILYYSLIDMSQNQGLGKVIEKNQIIIQDTLDLGKITATKHANGRDWWILVNEYESNLYYRILLSPDGSSEVLSQNVGQIVPHGSGQAVFSPDGSKFILFSVDVITTGYLNIYDFDRCSGELSNHIQLVLIEDEIAPGVAISPSSQFLYVSVSKRLYQYDLWAEDIESSKDTVAIYDGFTDPFATIFYLSQLAPDGKIYITSFSGSSVLHVIHEPDLRGEDCHVEQHGIDLPTYNAGSMPNFPNYRLGALEGSPCDTIVSSTNNIVAKVSSVKVYPNPAQDYLQVEIPPSFDISVPIELIDLQGRIVLTTGLERKTKSLTLSLEHLPNGIYFLKLTTGMGEVFSDKIIISRP